MNNKITLKKWKIKLTRKWNKNNNKLIISYNLKIKTINKSNINMKWTIVFKFDWEKKIFKLNINKNLKESLLNYIKKNKDFYLLSKNFFYWESYEQIVNQILIKFLEFLY